LVLQASQHEGGRLCDADGFNFTEGATWKMVLEDITDAAGDPVDLASATIVCKVVSTVVGAVADSEVVTVTATGGLGTLTLSLTSTETAGLAVGAGSGSPRRCWWYCTVSSAGSKVQFWGPAESNFFIYPAG
jgi:hypothetical protein